MKLYQNEDEARIYMESLRWRNGCSCPLCGGMERIKPVRMVSKPSTVNPEPREQKGWYHCGDCRRKFTVRTGTVYERSHVPLHKWVHAIDLLCASKKGMSAHQLHRMLGVTYKTAWFMSHRIREAMKTGEGPFGGGGKIVEADETYYGVKKGAPKTTIRGKTGHSGKRSIISLVERGGRVRSFHIGRADKQSITAIVAANVLKDSRLHTDESRLYSDASLHIASHEKVRHASGEFVRGDVHSNSVEGFFGIFKRGMTGIYQHCGERHLHRYLHEFDFRYNTRTMSDTERSMLAMIGAEGKRLTYRALNHPSTFS